MVLGVLGLIGGAALRALVFMPAAGFIQNWVPLAALERGAVALGAAALLRWLIFGGRVLPGAFLWGLAGATTLGLLALVTTTDLYATRETVFFLVAVVVVALAVVISVTDDLKARAVLGGLALVSAVEAIIGLGQYAAGVATPAYWLSRAFAGEIRTRIHGTLGNPNVLAGVLLVGIGATVLLAVESRGRWRVLPVAALIAQIVALALTYSRGGYAGLGAFVVSAAALLSPVRRRAWPILIIIAAVAGLAALTLPAVGLRAGSVTLDEADTAASRLFIWRAAVRMWQSHHVWGTGLGTFNAAYGPYRPAGVMTTYAQLRIPGSAHNDYLQVLAEVGLAGVVVLLGACVWGLWRAARRYRGGEPEDQVWLGTWAATIAAVGVTSVVNSTISVIPSVIMVVALTATTAGRAAGPRRPLRFRGRLLALPLAAVLAGLPPLLPAPGQALVLHDEANRLARAGRYRDAVDAFQKAVAVDPLNGTVLPYFGDLLADLYIRRIDSGVGSWRIARGRAAALYEQAERLSPWDGYPRAGLGRLRHAEGRYDEAVRSFREAIALDPYSPRYRLWLARTLAVVGDRRGATEQLREAVRLYPVEMLVIERHEGHSSWYAQDQTDLAEAHRLLSRVGRMAP